MTFNYIYQKIIVDLNFEKLLHFFYEIYLNILSIKNKIFLYLNIKSSFSSMYQDIWIIKNVFDYKKNLFFVDVGAYDGISNSNTLLFEKFYNWSGICIEPNKTEFSKLKKIRKNSKLLNCVISNFKKKSLRIKLQGQTSKIFFGKNFNNTSKVKNIGFSKVQPKLINFLSIDCEGFEEQVVGSINFKKKIDCILIERPNKAVHKLLSRNDYLLINTFLFDYLYISKKKFSECSNLNKIRYIPLPSRTI